MPCSVTKMAASLRAVLTGPLSLETIRADVPTFGARWQGNDRQAVPGGSRAPAEVDRAADGSHIDAPAISALT